MEYSFSKGLYDRDGELYDDSILMYVGKDTIIKFEDIFELERFANQILQSLPEIRQET